MSSLDIVYVATRGHHVQSDLHLKMCNLTKMIQLDNFSLVFISSSFNSNQSFTHKITNKYCMNRHNVFLIPKYPCILHSITKSLIHGPLCFLSLQKGCIIYCTFITNEATHYFCLSCLQNFLNCQSSFPCYVPFSDTRFVHIHRSTFASFFPVYPSFSIGLLKTAHSWINSIVHFINTQELKNNIKKLKSARRKLENSKRENIFISFEEIWTNLTSLRHSLYAFVYMYLPFSIIFASELFTLSHPKSHSTHKVQWAADLCIRQLCFRVSEGPSSVSRSSDFSFQWLHILL